ncbi:MAG: ribose-phosphate diphosphokinase [Pseudohongiellaceae bacterium]
MQLFTMPGHEDLGISLEREAGMTRGEFTLHRFPDGESRIQVTGEVQGADIAILCQLYQPDRHVLSLLLLVETLRDLGARRVGLIAPYLAYMRQDKRFNPGEGVSSHYFATLLSRYLDWLVTVDPHLHRIHDLGEIYSIPAQSLTSVRLIADWLVAMVERPLVIGPDSESEQWAASVARAAGCPWEVLEKQRFGDHDVRVSVPNVGEHRHRTPVLVDDIISTGRTMQQAAQHLSDSGFREMYCVAVHGLFAGGAREALRDAGLQVVTSNSIPDDSNQIDLAPLLSDACQKLI